MIYIFLSSVFITLFLTLGTFAFYGYLLRMLRDLPLSWTCYQQVLVLAIVAVLSLILACLFGTQIPNCYAI